MGRKLGQHFLADDSSAQRLVAATQTQPDELLLEIGPGRGALTRHLLELGRRRVLAELDERLADALQSSYRDAVEIVRGDVVDLELETLGGDRPWVLLGNLPYYHTSAILTWLCDQAPWVDRAVVTMQKEVAQRLLAEPGTKSYGRLGLLLQYHCIVDPLFDIPAEAFHPPPRVTSAAVRIRPRSAPAVEVTDVKRLFALIEHGFRWRRKTLSTVLKAWLPGGAEAGRTALAEAGIDPQRRAETLSLEEFATLSETVGRS